MSKKKKILIMILLLVCVPVCAVLLSLPLYYHDISEVSRSMEKGAMEMDSPYGRIEYIDIGEGKPVLLSHGTMGGHDHGLIMAEKLIGEGYRLIIPSRFGYLDSEMPEDPNFEKQADAYAYLIDQLGLEKVVVTGMSAGSVSAEMFAIKYPEQTAGLILVSSITYVPKDLLDPQELPVPASVYETVLNSDYLFWSIYQLSPDIVNSIFGVSEELTSQIDEDERKFVDDISKTFLPVSKRYAGWANDSKNISQLEDLPLEQIEAPTLVISAEDDGLAPHSWSEYLSGRIQGSEFVSFETGGHVLLGHTEEVKALCRKFIDEIDAND